MTPRGTLSCRTLPDRPVPDARASYRPAEYSLELTCTSPTETGIKRASIDSLTLQFGSDAVLSGLDAYTNSERWRREDLTPPAVDEQGQLLCLGDFDEHGIGAGPTGPVAYVYSSESALLKIEIGLARAHRWTRCLSCLIAGLGDNGAVCELWVTGLVLPAARDV